MSKFLSYENIILGFLILLTAVSGIYAYHLISILLPVLSLLILWQQKKQGRQLHLIFSPPLIFLFLFVFLAEIGILWTQAPFTKACHIFVSTFFTLIFATLLISVLKDVEKKTIQQAYTFIKSVGFLLISLILFQNMLDFFHVKFFKPFTGPYLMKPSGSILGLGTFIGCAFLWINNERVLAFSTFALMICIIHLTSCQTAFYGLCLASGVFLISYIAPFWATRFSLIGTYTLSILSPFLLPYIKSLLATRWVIEHPSFFHRMLGWKFLSEKFLENPFLGWGLGATPYLPVETNLAAGYANLAHPHNSSLQAFVELGLGGGILFSLFFASLFWVVEKYLKDPLSIAVCNATLSFGFVEAEISHSLWHNAWISWIAFFAGLLMIFLKARELQLHASVDHSKPNPNPLKE